MATPSDTDKGSVILIQPPRSFRKGNVWRFINRCLPPLGLASIAAVLERAGLPVQIVDMPARGLCPEKVATDIGRQAPRWVGIGATTVEINTALRLAALIKQAAPETGIMLGGAHPTALPREVAAHKAVDVVVQGEGEQTVLELARGMALADIVGITYRTPAGVIVTNEPRPVLADMDTLPMPAYHLLPMRDYRPSLGNFKRLPAISMVTTRGCPGRCTFCSTHAMGPKVRGRGATLLADEIELLVREYGIREISFYDDTITCRKANFTAFCEEILRRKLDITWSCMSRVDMVNPEILALMKRAGCHQVAYGVESSSPEILATIRKNIDIARVPEAVLETKKAGLDVRLMFMFGNPGETEATLRDTLRFALALNADLYVFNITVPFPGTEMFDWARKNGFLRTENWDDYDLSQSVLELPTVEPELVQAFYRKAYRRAYFQPRAMVRRAVKSFHPSEIRTTAQNLGFVLRGISREHR